MLRSGDLFTPTLCKTGINDARLHKIPWRSHCSRLIVDCGFGMNDASYWVLHILFKVTVRQERHAEKEQLEGGGFKLAAR